MAEAVEWIRIRRGYRTWNVGVVRVTHEVEAAFDLRGCRAHEARVGWRGARRLGGVPCRHRARAAEVGVRVVDSGVDDGDVDAGTGEAEGAPRLRRADEGNAVDVVNFERRHGVDGGHARQAGELRNVLLGHDHVDAVVGVLHLADDLGAGRGQLAVELVLLGGELVADGLLLARRKRLSALAGVGLLHRNRRVRHLQHNGHWPVTQRCRDKPGALADRLEQGCVDPCESGYAGALVACGRRAAHRGHDAEADGKRQRNLKAHQSHPYPSLAWKPEHPPFQLAAPRTLSNKRIREGGRNSPWISANGPVVSPPGRSPPAPPPGAAARRPAPAGRGPPGGADRR